MSLQIPPGINSNSIPVTDRSTQDAVLFDDAGKRAVGCIAIKQLDLLGKGSYGTVCQIENNSPRALKVPNQDISLWEAKNCYRAERKFLRKNIKTPHTLQLHADLKKSSGLVMDLIPGMNLRQLHSKGRIPTEDLILLFKQGLETLPYWKRNGTIHRDIKPENMIYNQEERQMTFVDGGLAIELDSDKMHASINMVGTPSYIAPEVICRVPYNHSVDLWSLAATIFSLYMTKLPFVLLPVNEKMAENHVLQRYAQTFGPIPPSYSKNCKFLSQYVDLIDGQILFKEEIPPQLFTDWRLRMKEAAIDRKDSPEVARELISLFEQIFVYENRILPEKALASPLFQDIFDFRFHSPQNLPDAWFLELYQGDCLPETRVARYRLCSRMNRTCQHLFDQTFGRKGGDYLYQLVQVAKEDGREMIHEQQSLAIDNGSLVRIDLNKPNGKVTVEETKSDD